ncbi:hypothetical protein Naga_100197g2 [Nannochloropsis gaditana]|uniref:Secreted protein n=1 Tax=Nannochloropsis gaditana TaxID=72520 RepID=W7TP96_9STRA|nr:hypothetical protein Naga_100197g2 [Nannochloropsis gaditana]
MAFMMCGLHVICVLIVGACLNMEGERVERGATFLRPQELAETQLLMYLEICCAHDPQPSGHSTEMRRAIGLENVCLLLLVTNRRAVQEASTSSYGGLWDGCPPCNYCDDTPRGMGAMLKEKKKSPRRSRSAVFLEAREPTCLFPSSLPSFFPPPFLSPPSCSPSPFEG